MISYTVKTPQKLKKSILNQYPAISPLVLNKTLAKKDIKVNKKRTNTNCDVFFGDIIEIYIDEQLLNKKSLDIIYQDENIIIVNKPTKTETTSLDKSRLTLETQIAKTLGQVFAVHRLDTNTTGLVIFAKSLDIQKQMIDAFSNHYIIKEYTTLVSANNLAPNGTFVDYLIKDAKKSIVKVTSSALLGAVEARLYYEVLNQKQNIYLLKIILQTGRTHQIRAQLAHHKIFVLGDGKYGDKTVNKTFNVKSQKLCATKISFAFPKTSTLFYLNKNAFEIAVPFEKFFESLP